MAHLDGKIPKCAIYVSLIIPVRWNTGLDDLPEEFAGQCKRRPLKRVRGMQPCGLSRVNIRVRDIDLEVDFDAAYVYDSSSEHGCALHWLCSYQGKANTHWVYYLP